MMPSPSLASRPSSHLVVRAVRFLFVTLFALVPSTIIAQARTAASPITTTLVVEGAPLPVRSAEGGEAVAEVLSAPGPDGVLKKQLGPVGYEPVVVQSSPGVAPLLAWIGESWKGTARPRDGTLVIGDITGKSKMERNFTGAQIVETSFPSLDAASKEPGYITVRLSPAAVVTRMGSGPVAGGKVTRTTEWRRSNFRFELGGLPTERVARIDSFTVRRSGGASQPGARREPARGSVRNEIPNLTISFSAADLQPWADWHDSFVVRGQNGDGAEKSGAIILLDQDLKSEVARLALGNCGISRLTYPDGTSSARLQHFTVELYCETMAVGN